MNTRLFAAIVLAGAALTGGTVGIAGCNSDGLALPGPGDMKPPDLTVKSFDGGVRPPGDLGFGFVGIPDMAMLGIGPHD
jgi:hypothetical protein